MTWTGHWQWAGEQPYVDERLVLAQLVAGERKGGDQAGDDQHPAQGVAGALQADRDEAAHHQADGRD